MTCKVCGKSLAYVMLIGNRCRECQGKLDRILEYITEEFDAGQICPMKEEHYASR